MKSNSICDRLHLPVILYLNVPLLEVSHLPHLIRLYSFANLVMKLLALQCSPSEKPVPKLVIVIELPAG